MSQHEPRPRKAATTHKVHPDGTRTPVEHEAEELALSSEGLRQVHKVQVRRG